MSYKVTSKASDWRQA